MLDVFVAELVPLDAALVCWRLVGLNVAMDGAVGLLSPTFECGGDFHQLCLQAAAAEDPGAAAALVDRIVAETRAQTDPVCPAWTRFALHTMARSNCFTHASLPQASGKPMAGLSDENVKGAIACVLTWQRVRGPACPCLPCNCGY